MNDHHDKLDQVLDAAGSADEREALIELWNDLGRLPVEDPPDGMPGQFMRLLDGAATSSAPPRFQWFQIAAALVFGVALGAILTLTALRTERGLPDLSLREAAITGVLPQPSASQRLVSLHAIGSLASTEPAFRAELLARAVYDATPAVQLAAIDHLARLDLSPAEAERLARALPEIASPIVQFTLLDLLGSRTEPKVLESIEALSRDPSVESLIRRHAEVQLENPRKETHA